MGKSIDLEYDIEGVSKQLYDHLISDNILTAVYEHRTKKAKEKLLEFISNKLEYRTTGERVKRHYVVIGGTLTIDDLKRIARGKSATLTMINILIEDLEKEVKIVE